MINVCTLHCFFIVTTSRCAALLETSGGRWESVTCVCVVSTHTVTITSHIYARVCFFFAEYWKQPRFFPQALIYFAMALVVVGPCVCVWWSDFRNARRTGRHVRMQGLTEKKKRAITHSRVRHIYTPGEASLKCLFFFLSLSFGNFALACPAQPLFP